MLGTVGIHGCRLLTILASGLLPPLRKFPILLLSACGRLSVLCRVDYVNVGILSRAWNVMNWNLNVVGYQSGVWLMGVAIIIVGRSIGDTVIVMITAFIGLIVIRGLFTKVVFKVGRVREDQDAKSRGRGTSSGGRVMRRRVPSLSIYTAGRLIINIWNVQRVNIVMNGNANSNPKSAIRHLGHFLNIVSGAAALGVALTPRKRGPRRPLWI